MFGFGLGVWLKVAAAAAVAVLIAGALWHYTTLRAERDEYLLKATHEQQAHAETKASFQAFVEENSRIAHQRSVSYEKIQTERDAAVAQVGDLRKKLAKHDLGMLASRKPGMIKKRVNDATRGVFAEIEGLTK